MAAAIIVQSAVILGLAYIVYLENKRKDERIDRLMKYIKPDTYRRNVMAESEAQQRLFNKKVSEEVDKRLKILNEV